MLGSSQTLRPVCHPPSPQSVVALVQAARFGQLRGQLGIPTSGVTHILDELHSADVHTMADLLDECVDPSLVLLVDTIDQRSPPA